MSKEINYEYLIGQYITNIKEDEKWIVYITGLLRMDENIGRDPIEKVTMNNKNQIIDDLAKVL